MKLLVILALVAAVPVFASETVDDIYTPVPEYISVNYGGGPVWNGPNAVLYTTGPFMNSPGTGAGGADESLMTSSEQTYGWGCQYANNNRMADDIVVPAGETWNVTSMTFFGYQTNSGTNPTINAIYVTIWDDYPSTGAVVYGDFTTNRFASASWTNCYRVLSTESGTGTARPIMAVVANITVSLAAGDYWVGYCMAGTGASGPWAPPIVNNPPGGATGNAMQQTSGGAWNPVLMQGTNTPVGMPIIVEGTSTSLSRDTWGSIKTLF